MNCRSAVTVLALTTAVLGGCAHPPPPSADLQGLLPTPVLLLGEQHDAPDHQRLQRQTLDALIGRGQAGALVLEMVERGRRTDGLPPDADPARVRQALDWSAEHNAGAWPWASYGPLVMAAVVAGVPVIGGNLPREQMRWAMREHGLDATLPAAALQRQHEAIAEGHCGLLPPSQLAPMARIQIARDRAMAQTVQEALKPGQTVLLVAGHQHVRRDIGVPQHLPGQALTVVVAQAGQRTPEADGADRVWVTPPLPPKDHCAELRQQWPR
jgi:uncharacterized iron-regulated protein